jgi:nucleoid-associated protein YgaU
MTATALRPAAPATRRPTPGHRAPSPRPAPRVAGPRADRHQRTVVIRRDEHAVVPAAVYRRRRLAVAAITIALVAVVVLLAGRVGQAGADLDGPAPAPTVYVVQPGDTLWSIAARVAPDADRRDVVGRLAAAAGGSDLIPGQRIELPRYID